MCLNFGLTFCKNSSIRRENEECCCRKVELFCETRKISSIFMECGAQQLSTTSIIRSADFSFHTWINCFTLAQNEQLDASVPLVSWKCRKVSDISLLTVKFKFLYNDVRTWADSTLNHHALVLKSTIYPMIVNQNYNCFCPLQW